MSTEKFQPLIDQYLSGLMDEQAKNEFEQQVSANPDLQAEVQRQQGLLDTSIEEGVTAYVGLKNKLDNIHHEVVTVKPSDQQGDDLAKKSDTIVQEKSTKAKEPVPQPTIKKEGRKIPIFKWIGGIAAGLVIAFFAWKFLQPGKLSTDELYAKYHKTEEISLTQMSGASSDLVKAEALFNEGKYKEAITIFDAHLDQKPSDFQVVLYKGIAHMELDQFVKAKKAFKKVTKSDTLFSSEGDWYEAINLLKQGRTKATKKALRAILNSESTRKSEAQKILDQLLMKSEDE